MVWMGRYGVGGWGLRINRNTKQDKVRHEIGEPFSDSAGHSPLSGAAGSQDPRIPPCFVDIAAVDELLKHIFLIPARTSGPPHRPGTVAKDPLDIVERS